MAAYAINKASSNLFGNQMIQRGSVANQKAVSPITK